MFLQCIQDNYFKNSFFLFTTSEWNDLNCKIRNSGSVSIFKKNQLNFIIQGSCVQNHWAAPRLTQPFILLSLITLVPGISGNLVMKSKLPPRSGTSLEVVEPHP